MLDSNQIIVNYNGCENFLFGCGHLIKINKNLTSATIKLKLFLVNRDQLLKNVTLWASSNSCLNFTPLINTNSFPIQSKAFQKL
jgi:hypothetical protein